MQLLCCRYNFPSRAEACQAVLELVLAHPDKKILIGVDKLGKGSTPLCCMALQLLVYHMIERLMAQQVVLLNLLGHQTSLIRWTSTLCGS